jgi:hypothetical protein
MLGTGSRRGRGEGVRTQAHNKRITSRINKQNDFFNLHTKDRSKPTTHSGMSALASSSPSADTCVAFVAESSREASHERDDPIEVTVIFDSCC